MEIIENPVFHTLIFTLHFHVFLELQDYRGQPWGYRWKLQTVFGTV